MSKYGFLYLRHVPHRLLFSFFIFEKQGNGRTQRDVDRRQCSEMKSFFFWLALYSHKHQRYSTITGICYGAKAWTPTSVVIPLLCHESPEVACLNGIRHYVHGFWFKAGAINQFAHCDRTYIIAHCQYQGFDFTFQSDYPRNRYISALLQGDSCWFGNLVVFEIDAVGTAISIAEADSDLDAVIAM